MVTWLSCPALRTSRMHVGQISEGRIGGRILKTHIGKKLVDDLLRKRRESLDALAWVEDPNSSNPRGTALLYLLCHNKKLCILHWHLLDHIILLLHRNIAYQLLSFYFNTLFFVHFSFTWINVRWILFECSILSNKIPNPKKYWHWPNIKCWPLAIWDVGVMCYGSRNVSKVEIKDLLKQVPLRIIRYPAHLVLSTLAN